MSYKKEYWVLDSVSYMNKPPLPKEIHDAIAEMGQNQEWGNDCKHDVGSVSDLEDESPVIHKFLKEQGGLDDDKVLISYWW